MANRRFTQFYYTLHTKPTQLDCNFVVDSNNGNGLGIRSLKGPGIANVYMHTNATPAASNPNPASGYIYVKFQENYNRYYFGDWGTISPLSGTNVAVTAAGALLTVGSVYVITSVGSSTLADWIALGVPVGITPAPGVPFVAKATGAGVGTGQVQLPKTGGSGIQSLELIGDPNTTLNSAAPVIATGTSGSYMIIECLNAAGTLAAPVDGTVMALSFILSNSSITNLGE